MTAQRITTAISATILCIVCALCSPAGPALAGELGLIPMDRKIYESYLKRKPFRKPFAALPAHYDWRTSDAVTPARNQGKCGSCWAFSATAAFESKILIGFGIEYDLAEQMLVSCYGPPKAFGCCGGELDAVRFYETAAPPAKKAATVTATAVLPTSIRTALPPPTWLRTTPVPPSATTYRSSTPLKRIIRAR